jgi:hypothetical protein
VFSDPLAAPDDIENRITTYIHNSVVRRNRKFSAANMGCMMSQYSSVQKLKNCFAVDPLYYLSTHISNSKHGTL